MTEQTIKEAKKDKLELSEEELAKVQGGYGRSSYYSYSSGRSVSYTTSSSGKN